MIIKLIQYKKCNNKDAILPKVLVNVIIKKNLGGDYFMPQLESVFEKIKNSNEYEENAKILEVWLNSFKRGKKPVSNEDLNAIKGFIFVEMKKLIDLIPKTADYTAAGLYEQLCVPIHKEELMAGDLIFRQANGSINHVGIYIGNGEIVEARGKNYGVIRRALTITFK
jgi:hypothetical protein